MMHRQANPTDAGIHDPGARLEHHRGSVRRRRARKAPPQGRWIIARSRARTFRTAAVCTGVLLLMALGLYFGLSREDAGAPGAGVFKRGVVGLRGIV